MTIFPVATLPSHSPAAGLAGGASVPALPAFYLLCELFGLASSVVFTVWNTPIFEAYAA